MAGLSKDAAAFLDSATDMACAITKQGEGEQPLTQEGMAANAIVDAITALCYEVAALREATYAKLADIESTLYSRGK